MAKNQSNILNWSQYLGLRSLAALLHTFNIEQNLRTGRALGRTMYKLDKRRRKRAIENLQRSFPQMPLAEVEKTAARSMEHFIQLAMEVFFTTRLIDTDTWPDLVELNNIQPAVDALLNPEGAIMVTGHYGNWEVLGYLLATLGLESSAIARPIDNPLINHWLLSVRERKGLKIITKFGATDEVTSVLDKGGAVGFIGDQNAGDKGIFVPFFNKLASAYKSIGLLAIQYNVPVICGYAHRLNDQFRFEVGIEDVIYPDDWKQQPDPLYYITARYTRALELMVRRQPHQYLWIHRRWKSRPRHERLEKPMPRALRTKLQDLPWMDDKLLATLEADASNP